MTDNLHTLESEVEEARAKLAEDLALLRSPQTYRRFGADLTSEAHNRVVTAVQRATAQAITDNGVRDQVLLGVAGAAVVAALGIAYRRRKPDELRAWE